MQIFCTAPQLQPQLIPINSEKAQSLRKIEPFLTFSLRGTLRRVEHCTLTVRLRLLSTFIV